MQVALGRAAERRGELDQAMAAYKDALKRDKNRSDAHHRLAVLHDRRGDFRQSAELYRLALAADPGNPDLYCDMGYSLYLQRRWAESETNLRQAIALRPDLARAHNNLGLVLAHNLRTEEALAEYRKAGNDEAKARSNLALAMTLDGRYDEAREQYRKIPTADPSAKVAEVRVRELDALASQSASRPPANSKRDSQTITTSASGSAARPQAVSPIKPIPTRPKPVVPARPRPAVGSGVQVLPRGH